MCAVKIRNREKERDTHCRCGGEIVMAEKEKDLILAHKGGKLSDR